MAGSFPVVRMLAGIPLALVVVLAARAAVQDIRSEPTARPLGIVPAPRVIRLSVAARAQPPGLTVAAGRVAGAKTAELAAPAIGPLMGSLAPVAVPTRDGRGLVYSTWSELRRDDPARSWSEQGITRGEALGRPSLRLHDLATGTDSLIEDGAFSAALRADGALAYVRGTSEEYRAGERYLADVVVRAHLRAPAALWSVEPDRYVVAAWAGQTLLAYRIREGERLDVLAFDGPGRQRILAEDVHLVAVDPDGARVLVGDGSAVPATVRVLDVTTGAERASLPLAAIPDNPIQWVSYGGSWAGDLVAARTDAGVAVFRVAERSIEAAELLRPDPDAFPHGLFEPQFVDSGERIVARADVPEGPGAAGDEGASVLLHCRRRDGSCARSEPVRGRDWLRFVYDPSRPQRGGR